MSVQASVFVATSLDGFIAREDGSFDWIDKAGAGAPADEDFGYAAFFASVDALVMGRNTFEQVLTFDKWPYGDKPLIVLTSRPLSIPTHLAKTVTSSSEAPAELLNRLSAQGVQHVYVDGGVTIQRFLTAGLIDDLTITLIPVLLGAGKRLFGPLDHDLSLTHIEARTFDCGFVQVRYKVAKGVPEGHL